MARRLLPFAALAALLGLLAGCSNYERPRRPPWRAQAEAACFAQRPFALSAYIQPTREIDGPGICGLTRPLKVYALSDGQVAFSAPYTLDCPMVATLNRWVAEVVQPTASARFGARVVEIIGMGAYSCRAMNGAAYGYGRVSEHAFGNALDVAGFRLSDGREIRIVRDWTRGDEQTRAFLQEVHMGACSYFTTVLGPGANVFHYNHIHVDLAMHGGTSTGPRRICKPFLTPSAPAAPNFSPVPRAAPPPAPDGLPEPPEIDEEVDVAKEATDPVTRNDVVQAGPGPAPLARIPDEYFRAAMRPPAAIPSVAARAQKPAATVSTPAPAARRAPEGSPADWDLTSSIAARR
ncbi:extensin family protein [Methylocella sp.]|uniref:extensin-like domain-containing protein n=1 Tax=Methylocella sp. TaxID=1978226 RepID=UPI00378309A0